MPAVNYDAMYQALVRDAQGTSSQIVYLSRLLDWKNQTLTPNPAIYLMPFYDTTKGPMVLEIPPADDGSITGSIDDAWQAALADVGPAGIDAGKGGKCLILPPHHDGSVPDGYLAPEPPDGLESNWVPTKKDGRFEVLRRFYGPGKAFFDKTWKLPDVERVH